MMSSNDTSLALMNANYASLPTTNIKTNSATSHTSQSDALLKEQTDKFEAFFLKQILDIATDTEEQDPLFPKDAGDKIYRSMYNDTMSSALSGGLGISQMLFNYLKEGR